MYVSGSSRSQLAANACQSASDPNASTRPRIAEPSTRTNFFCVMLLSSGISGDEDVDMAFSSILFGRAAFGAVTLVETEDMGYKPRVCPTPVTMTAQQT